MNHYTLAELSAGMQASFTASFSHKDLDTFCALTGDENPLHQTDAYAGARGFAGRVVYGMLVAGLFSTLAGVYLPGEFCLLHEVQSSFSRPVYVNETLTVSGIITEKHEAFRRVTIKARVQNSAGETVCRGLIQAGVLQ